MPKRVVPLVNGEYYHVLNRGVEKRPIFLEKRNYARFLETVKYYRFANQPIKLSGFLKISLQKRVEIENTFLKRQKPLVSIISYVLMPNHFHLLLRQEINNGISEFIRNVSNSYTKYFNTKNDRVGHLFQGPFKCVYVESDNQLLHLSRYIHLNPYTSHIIKTTDELDLFPWSSLSEYISKENSLCDQEIIISHFSNREKYKDFVLNNAEYQKNLEYIKHLALE